MLNTASTPAHPAPLFGDDTLVFGLLTGILALVFYTSSRKGAKWRAFYKIVPPLFLCYFIPALLTTTGVIHPDYSNVYTVAKNYCLPGALILMTLSIDFRAIVRLGPKALIMFGTATVGIIIGGPLAVLITAAFSPETVAGVGDEATWKGLATLAGSWIGGGANQTAMLEVYGYKKDLYGGMVTVDIVVANLLMASLLIGISYRKRMDRWLKADTRAIDELVQKMETFQRSVSKTPTTTDLMVLLGIAFTGTGIAHFLAQHLSSYFEVLVENPQESVLASHFFWLVLIATFFGFAISFTSARKLEGAGASKVGTLFIYILVATIGMKMDLYKVLDKPLLVVVGLLWMVIHIGILFFVAKLIKAPYFFLAVGSQANVGGAASAPVVAGAFHPALTTVGVLLAVLGYFVGTIGAILCAEMMRLVAPT